MDGRVKRWSSLAFLKGLVSTETRFVARLYLQRVFILAFVTIAIVVALDISTNFQRVMSFDSEKIGFDGSSRLFYYALLRVGFISPSVFLFAGVWGVVWAEYSLSVSRERIMMSNCGQPILVSLIPAMLVGTFVGVLQFSNVAYLRPLTVELEATTTHRNYGPKFKRPIVTSPTWISGNGFILNARIDMAESIGLKDAYLYRFDAEGSVQKIITASHAEPIGNRLRWKFHDVTVRQFSTKTTRQRSESLAVSVDRMDELDLRLALRPIWLENYNVLPTLLPHSTLATLVGNDDGVLDLYRYRMAFHERYAGILYCFATVLLSVYLALSWFPPNMLPFRALGVALVGFGAYFFFSVSLMFGHFGYLPVLIAAWGIPLSIATIFLGLLVRHLRIIRSITGPRKVSILQT